MSHLQVTQVKVRDANTVRVITLDRPAAHNRFTATMHAELCSALGDAADDARVRCVVLTGAGDAFCAGQQLDDPALSTPEGRQARIEGSLRPLAEQLREMPVPVVVAVNGLASGTGASLALSCDVVLAARSAAFEFNNARLGLAPDLGASWLLARLVGRARALALAMSGERISAEAAEQCGLIWRCVDDAALHDQAVVLAARLTRLPTRALVATRELIDASMSLDRAGALERELAALRELARAHDAQEGLAAHLARRAPLFEDR